jgi:hypothetical protein
MRNWKRCIMHISRSTNVLWYPMTKSWSETRWKSHLSNYPVQGEWIFWSLAPKVNGYCVYMMCIWLQTEQAFGTEISQPCPTSVVPLHWTVPADDKMKCVICSMEEANGNHLRAETLKHKTIEEVLAERNIAHILDPTSSSLRDLWHVYSDYRLGTH